MNTTNHQPQLQIVNSEKQLTKYFPLSLSPQWLQNLLKAILILFLILAVWKKIDNQIFIIILYTLCAIGLFSSTLFLYFDYQKQKKLRQEAQIKKYLLTYGVIKKIQHWNKKKLSLIITIKYQDINNRTLEKDFKINYPQINLSKNNLVPHQLIGQQVKLYLLPHSYTLLLIEVINFQPHNVLIEFKQARTNPKIPVGLCNIYGLTNSNFLYFNAVEKIKILRNSDNQFLEIHFQQVEFNNFILSESMQNFYVAEQTFLDFFAIDQNYYQELKNKALAHSHTVWKSPRPILNQAQRKSKIKQIEKKYFTLFLYILISLLGCSLILFFISEFLAIIIFCIIVILFGFILRKCINLIQSPDIALFIKTHDLYE